MSHCVETGYGADLRLMPTPVPETLAKARAYCARQERCQQEVRDKLYGWGAHKSEVEPIIARLIAERYLDEKRFAEHFALSKARQKGWGPKKIEQALRIKQVSEPCIALGLKAVDGEETAATLKRLIDKRSAREKEPDAFLKRRKVIAFFLRKGYAQDAVERAMSAE